MNNNNLTADKLRIGNIIASAHNKENKETWTIGKVIEISNIDNQYEQILVETKEEYTWFFKDNYFSIPLTKEYLEKFGFKINRITKEDNNIWRKEYANGYFELEEIITFFFGHPVYSTELKTIDHLQNLFFFITGEELILNIDEE